MSRMRALGITTSERGLVSNLMMGMNYTWDFTLGTFLLSSCSPLHPAPHFHINKLLILFSFMVLNEVPRSRKMWPDLRLDCHAMRGTSLDLKVVEWTSSVILLARKATHLIFVVWRLNLTPKEFEFAIATTAEFLAIWQTNVPNALWWHIIKVVLSNSCSRCNLINIIHCQR